MDKIILASASPRRQEILKQMGICFEVKPQDVDESFTGRPPADEAVHLAQKKAESYLAAFPDGSSRWVLAADTFIALDKNFIGKPSDREGARKMLEMLSGRTHQVISGIALNIPDAGMKTAHCITDVLFAALTSDEIEWYLDTNEWEGAAAAYRIQEKGAAFVESITGSYSNVMGLPINTIYGMLIGQIIITSETEQFREKEKDTENYLQGNHLLTNGLSLFSV